MTTNAISARARKHAIPLAWASALTLGALLYRGELLDWFGLGDSTATSSPAVALTAGELSLEASLQPAMPTQGDNSLELTFRDRDGDGIGGATIEVIAVMPPMGNMAEMRTTAAIAERGDGAYRATFALAMNGTWTLLVNATMPAGELSAEYKITVGTLGLVPVSATARGTGTSELHYTFNDSAQAELRRALAAYEQLRSALADDSLDGIGTYGQAAANALLAAKTADTGIPTELSGHLTDGAAAAAAVRQARELASARTAFADLSEHLISATSADPRLTSGLHAFVCPMTAGYNKWLQTEPQLRNPYQGTQMLTCGSEIPVQEALPSAEVHADIHDPDDIAHYTCPMDTWVKQIEPGSCPVCGMDLIAVTKEEVRTGVMRIDHHRRQLIGLKTGLVERRNLVLHVNAVGRVAYDETRLAEVTLKYDGWIEKLHVEQTGQKVRRGQPLMTVYSPELYSAQQEYLLALSQRDAAMDEPGRARATALLRGARQRLKLWDVSDAQLARLAKQGEPLQYFPVVAPASGYIVAKEVIQGAAVKRGQRLFRIAALDKVWVEADIYEKDIPLVKVGQSAVVTLTHLPGRRFEGTVSFIYPYLDAASRTSRARIELANAELELKPDMFANVELQIPLGERLVVPEAAVIYSGPRRVVFLDMEEDQLRPMPIEVGAKSDGYFEVISGLSEGDRVVTSGNFLLSAESRLKAATGLW